MAMKRQWTNYFTTAANGNEQLFNFVTEDDYRVRHVKHAFAGIATAGVAITFYTTGQEYSKVDCTRFAAGDDPLNLEFDAQPQQVIVVGITNLAGAALTNVPIIIGYEVDAGTGP